jgi:hypothetical protein
MLSSDVHGAEYSPFQAGWPWLAEQRVEIFKPQLPIPLVFMIAKSYGIVTELTARKSHGSSSERMGF